MNLEQALAIAQQDADQDRKPAYVLRLVNGRYAVVKTDAIQFQDKYGRPEPPSLVREIATTVSPRPPTDDEWYGGGR